MEHRTPLDSGNVPMAKALSVVLALLMVFGWWGGWNATANAGNTDGWGDEEVSLTVSVASDNTHAPVSKVVQGTTVKMTADVENASDEDGWQKEEVVQVDFYEDGELVGTDDTGPAYELDHEVQSTGLKTFEAKTRLKRTDKRNNNVQTKTIEDDAAVRGVKLDIATGTVKICKELTSFTVTLTEDSDTGGEVDWSGVAGTDNGDNFVINPSTVGDGVYTITAAVTDCPGAQDAVKIKVTTWTEKYDAEDVFAVAPAFDAASIKAMGNLTEFEATFTAKVDTVKDSISALIDTVELQALEDKWSLVGATAGPFVDWLDAQLDETKAYIEGKIEEQATAAKAAIPGKIDTLAADIATRINNTFSADVTAEATYTYASHEFDPGTPGWSPPTLTQLALDEVRTSVDIGFSVNVALQPAGVGIGSLLIKAEGKMSFSAEVTGFHGTPGSWESNVNHPGPVTSEVTLNFEWDVDCRYRSHRRSVCEAWRQCWCWRER